MHLANISNKRNQYRIHYIAEKKVKKTLMQSQTNKVSKVLHELPTIATSMDSQLKIIIIIIAKSWFNA